MLFTDLRCDRDTLPKGMYMYYVEGTHEAIIDKETFFRQALSCTERTNEKEKTK